MKLLKIFLIFLLLLMVNLKVLAKQSLVGKLSGHYETMNFSVWASSDKEAKTIAREAEKYYKKLLRKLRYGGMLRKNCQVYIYENKKDYVDALGEYGFFNIEHTRGIHFKKGYNYPSVICSYEDNHLLGQILPHELTHAVFKEFILGMKMDKKIPLWINEGIAVYMQEESDYKTVSKYAIKNNENIKLEELISLEYYPQDQKKNAYFYAQSASLVDFLLKKYPGSKFLSFSKKMTFTDRKPEEILTSVYYSKIKSIQHLERLWMNYVENTY